MSVTALFFIASVAAGVSAPPIQDPALPPPQVLNIFASTRAIDGALSSALGEVRSGVLSDLQSAPREHAAFDRWLKQITALYLKRYLRFIELTAQ